MSNQLPPQSSDAEESILGALLIDGEVMLEIADSLKPADFYKPAHAKVYSAIQRLYEQSQPIDILT
ncbi:MAG: DnaB-like helicase N-terminal domain-containing protein, partial [Candidatus Limnocylindrus sp.]